MEESKVSFCTEDGSLQKLYDAAEQGCLENIRSFAGRDVLVEGGGYEKIWLETQPMGGAMYAKRNFEVALNNQLFFMENQREDGRLPGSIALIDGKVVPQYNKFQGFCFPDPALDVYYLTGKRREYLEELYRTLIHFDTYLWKVRDSDGDGCVETWCRYDTGEDKARRYGDAPDAWTAEYPAASDTVPIASMDIMSFSYSARAVSAEAARLLGREEDAADWQRKARSVARKIREYLWSEKKQALYDRDKHHRQMPVLIHNTLRAMYWGSVSQEMAEGFVKWHLVNPCEFWTPMPLPSVAADDPLFFNDPENDWSGQCEALTYQRAIRALENYGFYDLIPKLGQKLFDAIGDDLAFVQQFDPFTGRPSGIGPNGEAGQKAYGPSMLSVLEYCSRMYGVHIVRDSVVWGTVSGKSSVYEQQWNGHSWKLVLDGAKAIGYIDGKMRFESGRDMRIQTDLEGNITRTDSFT